MGHFYITGDTHGDFGRIFRFCDVNETTTDDVMIILGDAGINYYSSMRDNVLKQKLSELEVTLFCIHGNHEERPYLSAGVYEEKEWNGGIVYVEEAFPNILFAKDGEIYNFNGRSVIVIGGAYSVDKYYRLSRGLNWYESEQPSQEIKSYVEEQLKKAGMKVDIVLTHTVPVELEPTWAFIPGVDQSKVDKTTEYWLQDIYDSIEFEQWFAGHYHVECEEEGVRIMFEDYDEICEED